MLPSPPRGWAGGGTPRALHAHRRARRPRTWATAATPRRPPSPVGEAAAYRPGRRPRPTSGAAAPRATRAAHARAAAVCAAAAARAATAAPRGRLPPRMGWGGGRRRRPRLGGAGPLVGYLRSNPNRFLTHGRPGSPAVARRRVGAVDATPPPDRHPRRAPPRVAPTIPPCAWERRHPVCTYPSPSPLHPHPRPPPLPSWCLFAAMLASRW